MRERLQVAESPLSRFSPRNSFAIANSRYALDGFVSARAENLLACESQRRAAAAFDPAQVRFLVRDVVARDGNHILPLGQLNWNTIMPCSRNVISDAAR